MSKFLQAISENKLLQEGMSDHESEFLYFAYSDEPFSVIAEELEITEEEAGDLMTELFAEFDGQFISEVSEVSEIDYLSEELVKRVTSTGQVSRVQSREVRKRRASATTGMSKAKLKLRAKKAAKTKKRSGSTLRKAAKKRAKAMKRRKAMFGK